MTEINMESILKEIVCLEKKRDRLSAALHEVTSMLDHLQKTVEHFSPKPKKRAPTVAVLNIDPDTLRGKTLAEALVYLAKQNDGLVKNSAVRPLLVDAGILCGKNPAHTLSVTLRNSEQFEPVSRGQFKLVDDVWTLDGAPVDEAEDDAQWPPDEDPDADEEDDPF